MTSTLQPSALSDYPREKISLGILAGGQGRRMGGEDKGLSELAGRPLISHVLERLKDQAGSVWLNANRNLERYRALGYPVITDNQADFSGPLAGIVALLEAVKTEWLLVAPCDTPDLPADLGPRLYQAAINRDADIAIARDGRHRHPVVALIRKRLAGSLQSCLASGERKIICCYQQQALVEVDFSEQPEAFINLNSSAERAFWLGLQAGRQAKALNRSLATETPLLGIAAWSGVGKTTLLTRLLPELKHAGLLVAVIKHAHHDFDPDLPGKDSFELRKAGARQMLVASDRRWALISEEIADEQPDLNRLLDQLDQPALDLILVEGFKQTRMAKLELYRPALNKPLRYPDDPSIMAIACPKNCHLQDSPPRLDLDRPEELAQFVLGFQNQARKDLP